MSSEGRRLLSAIVADGSVKTLIGLSNDLFKDGEKGLFDFIVSHVSKFGKVPSAETIEEHVGDVLVPTSETVEYYLEQCERRFLHNSLKKTVLTMQDFLKMEDSDKALQSMLEAAAELHQRKHKKNLFDFREIADLIYLDYKAKQMGDDGDRLMFGWETLDAMTNGVGAGDFVAYVGRPASGKTFKLLYSALNGWESKAHTPMFVSMEMMNIVIAQRLAAMHTSKNLTKLMKAMMTTKAWVSMMEKLKQAKKYEKPLWMVDGNLTATVSDIVMMTRQMKPTCVFVDGAYLLQHPNPKASKFDKITDNAEALKQKVATDLGIPVICSYQLNREAAKKFEKNKEDIGLEDIYGSDAIGQLATVVLGLFEEDNVETQKQRTIDIMKGRNGERGRFKINWGFDTMDFSEIKPEAEAKTLEYL